MKTVQLPKPEYYEQNALDFKEALQKQGWEWVGGGVYASVYTHPKKPGKALKVAANDAAYNDWLSIVLANQKNPYFPRVFSVKRYVTDDSYSLTVVLMERLDPASRDSYSRADGWVRRLYELTYITNGFRNRWEMQVKAALAHILMAHRCDFHTGNIMLRGNQLVITDPVC